MTDGSIDSGVLVAMTGEVPQQVMELAQELARIHGKATIHDEAHGIHIHIPNPELVETDGLKEVNFSRHLQINAEKYLGIGRYDVDLNPTAENRKLYDKYRRWNREVPCTYCQKTGKRNYTVYDLLTDYKPLNERGLNLPGIIPTVQNGASLSNNLIDDGTGTMVPAPCGKTVPLESLPENHPARVYMTARGFTVQDCKAYGLQYCTEAAPEDRSKGVYYSRIADNLRNTYTGRIILPIRVDGHQVGYQGRVVERTSPMGKYAWNGNLWVRVTDAAGNSLLFAGKKLNKYMSATGMRRNSALFGYDSAVLWNLDTGRHGDRRTCVLVEGPLDALRAGPPAVAMLGASLAPAQAQFIVDAFARVIVVGDNDTAGERAVSKVYDALESAGFNMAMVDRLTVPDGKDLGDMERGAAAALLHSSRLWPA